MDVRRSLTSACIAVAVATAAYPQARPAPLPDPETFLREARQRLASDAELQAHYTYKERVTELRLNPLGRLGTGPERLYEVYPMPDWGITYRRLVARDGVPIPAGELAEHDREFARRLERARRERPDADDRRREAEARRRQRAVVDDVVATLAFTITGRDSTEGEPAVIVSFQARPDARPRTREGRIVQHFRGQAWVHEAEFQVMRVEAEAVEHVTFGFGLIGRLNKGSAGTFTRKKVNGVTWLPVEARFRGTGRALFLLRRLEIDFVREYFDYRPRVPGEPLPFLRPRG